MCIRRSTWTLVAASPSKSCRLSSPTTPSASHALEREARVLASLNSPHIAALYGLERSGTQTFLVMELVPGETLAD